MVHRKRIALLYQLQIPNELFENCCYWGRWGWHGNAPPLRQVHVWRDGTIGAWHNPSQQLKSSVGCKFQGLFPPICIHYLLYKLVMLYNPRLIRLKIFIFFVGEFWCHMTLHPKCVLQAWEVGETVDMLRLSLKKQADRYKELGSWYD